MTPPEKTLMDYHQEHVDAIDVITDGAGNVYDRKCPRCKTKTVTRIAYGTCRCTRCGQ